MLKVVLGGTFEFLHAGHLAMIREAFSLIVKEGHGCGIVHIGLTSDEMAGKKSHAVSSYSQRKEALEKCIHEILRENSLPEDSFMISGLNDPFGPAATDDYDYIVVSPETKKGAELINRMRAEKKLRPLTIREVPFVPAEDGIPISSTRIFYGEIDRDGRLKNRHDRHPAEKRYRSSSLTAFDQMRSGDSLRDPFRCFAPDPFRCFAPDPFRCFAPDPFR